MDEKSQLDIVREHPLAWLALLTWQAMQPGLYQAHVDAYQEWEAQCPKGISTAVIVAELKERFPQLVHEQRRQG